MLRCAPTVIFLTVTEVSELEHRRRFRRRLELDDSRAHQTQSWSQAPVMQVVSIEPSSMTVPRVRVSPSSADKPPRAHIPVACRPPPLFMGPGTSTTENQMAQAVTATPEPNHRQEQQRSTRRAGGRTRAMGTWPGAVERPATRTVAGSPTGEPRTVRRDVVQANSDLGAPGASAVMREEESEFRRHRRPARDPFRGTPDDVAHFDFEDEEPGEELALGAKHPSAQRSSSSTTGADTPEDSSDEESPASTADMPRTPSQFRVYNDFLPASSQPQTPQNLPEARHQSHLRGSHTVPARYPVYPPRTPRPDRRRGVSRVRDLSPPGLQRPGFTGLYGGMENSDDLVLYSQASEAMRAGSDQIPSPPGLAH